MISDGKVKNGNGKEMRSIAVASVVCKAPKSDGRAPNRDAKAEKSID